MGMKTLEDFRQPDGWYKDDEGCGYETSESLLSSGMLGFCGCGSPEDALEYVRGALQLINDLKTKVWEKLETYESWAARVKAHLGESGSEYFMWYFLDNKDFTEHGGSVPGWLTDSGKQMLAYLDEWADSLKPTRGGRKNG